MLVLEITVDVFVSIRLEEIIITADTILSKIKPIVSFLFGEC